MSDGTQEGTTFDVSLGKCSVSCVVDMLDVQFSCTINDFGRSFAGVKTKMLPKPPVLRSLPGDAFINNEMESEESPLFGAKSGRHRAWSASFV